VVVEENPGDQGQIQGGKQMPHRFFGKRVVLAGAAMTVLPALVLAGAAAQASSVPAHRLGCVLVSGRLYLGDAGAAGPGARFVVCDVSFRQVHPRSDGVILVLRTPHHRSVYSILKPRFGLPPSRRTLLPWRHHPGAAAIGCALAAGRLYLGSSGPAQPRTRTTCSVRLYQMTPAADGVTVVLRSAHHASAYSVVLRKLPHRPAGSTLIRWIS
jgi:hypothetical protein